MKAIKNQYINRTIKVNHVYYFAINELEDLVTRDEYFYGDYSEGELLALIIDKDSQAVRIKSIDTWDAKYRMDLQHFAYAGELVLD